MYGKFTRGDVGRKFLIVTTCLMGIDAILEEFRGIVALAEEGQVNFHIAGAPVGHTSHIPIIPAAARRDYIFAHNSIQYHRFVPHCRNTGYELRAFGLGNIIRG